MKINVDKLNKRLEEGAARKAQRARSRSVSEEAPVPDLPRVRGAAHRGYPYFGLADFIASGDFRRLIVRPDGRDGGTWTLKGVLVVPAGSEPVYMHGRVDSLAEVLPLIDRLLREGCWHLDRYPSKEDL